MWLRIRASAGSCKHGNETFGFTVKRGNIFLTIFLLLASQERLSSMEVVFTTQNAIERFLFAE
jgi:hypothetical protein